MTIQVSASAAWSDTGIDIPAGCWLVINSTGSVAYGPDANQVVDANGVNSDGTKFFSNAVLPNAIVVSLIGKIGGSTNVGTGTPLPEGSLGNGAGFVGSAYSRTISSGGRLFLGFNDTVGSFDSNFGSFMVSILLTNAGSLIGKGDLILTNAVLNTAGSPAVDASGRVAFLAGFAGLGKNSGVNAANNFGILLVDGDQRTILARTGDQAPDTSGNSSAAVFSKLSDPVLNEGGHFAFIAELKTGVGNVSTSNSSGVWSDAGGALQQIVREGDVEPGGGGGKFSKFDQIVLCDNGNTIFQATLRDLPATQKQGLWLAKNGTITRLVKTGQTLQFNGVSKALSAVHIFQFTPNLSGQTRSFDPGSGTITYQATFTDGTWGIYVIAGDQ